MATVETVRGPVDTGDLGTTLMHEHVFVLTPDIMANYGDEYWDEEVRVADAIEKLRRLRDLGVTTIVDPTVVGLGRYIPRVARINAEVDLHIVVATGLYTFDEIPHFLHYRGPDTLLGGDEPMVQMFVKDIREGIAGTGIKAAFLKGVVEERGLTPDQTRVAARHRRHPRRDRRADHGAHQQRAPDRPARARPATRRRASTSPRSSSGTRATATTSTTCARSPTAARRSAATGSGWTSSTRPSSGSRRSRRSAPRATPTGSCSPTTPPATSTSSPARPAQAALAQAAPNWHYEHIHHDVLPALREQGVSDEQITTMLVENPRRYFS